MEGMHILKERNVDPKGNPMGIGYLNNDKGNDLLEHREKLGCLCIHCGNVLEQHWQVTKLWANEWKATIEKLEKRIEELEQNRITDADAFKNTRVISLEGEY